MAKIGLTDNLLDFLVKENFQTILAKDDRNQSVSQKEYENHLSKISACLRTGAAAGDPELSLKLERACINFDMENYAVTPKDRERLDRYISQNGAAEKSLDYLKSNPAAYRQHINELFPSGVTTLPEGDVYITHARAQIKNLAQAQAWMSTFTEKDFLAARIENLKAGIKAFKELQRSILFPPTTIQPDDL